MRPQPVQREAYSSAAREVRFSAGCRRHHREVIPEKPVSMPRTPPLPGGLRAWVASLPVPATGLCGSLLVAAGGLFMGRLADTPGVHLLVLLQAWPHARPTGYVLVFTGLALLTLAWLGLGRKARGADDGVRRVVRATGLWATPLLVIPPLFSNDVWSYVAQGQLVAQGRSPYVYTPSDLSGPIVHAVSAAWVHSPSPYGPLPLIWGGLVAHASTNPWFDLFGFRLLAVAGLLALAFSVPAIARRAGRDPASAVWLVLASPFTLAHGIAAAHLDLAVAGLLCLALYAALRGSWAIGAVMVGAATAVKAPALLVDAAVVLASLPNVSTGFSGTPIRLRRALEVIALSTATVLVLGLVSGLGTGWVGGLSTPLGHHSPLSPSTELGVHIGALLGLNLVMLAHLMAALLLLAVVGYVVLHAPARSAADVVLAAAAVMSAAILLSPVVHYWYFFWCLPFLACAGLPRRLGRVSVATTVALGLLAPVELTRHHLPFSGTMMLFGLGAALLTVLEPRDARRVASRYFT